MVKLRMEQLICPNCGSEFKDDECQNPECDDPWDLAAIESMDKAIESARTKPSKPWTPLVGKQPRSKTKSRKERKKLKDAGKRRR